MRTEANDPAKVAFHQGYATACANILRLYGTDVNAREVLTQVFPDMESLSKYAIDSYDLEVLVPLMKEHVRLRKLQKRRCSLKESSTEN